ncbi:MAG: glycosyl transferase [Terrimonas sp.]|nr:glycosyl transferase [Terrimonas sp.]
MPKFLIIRFSSIGDIVLTTPVIRCLKKQVEGAAIHFLTKEVFLPVVAANPYIDKIHVLAHSWELMIHELQLEEFDYVIDLHHNLRTLRVKNALGVPHFSFHKLNTRKFIYTNLKWNLMPDIHIVDRYLATVASFSVQNDGMGLDYFIPENEQVQQIDIPAAHHAGYIGVVIGAAHATKKMPVEKLKDLCSRISHPLVLLGGKEDRANGDLIAATDAVKIYNACGKFSLNESADLVKRAKLIITHDTGLMHIAAAFGKPVIAIWGNTVPAFGMYPYYGNRQVWNRRFEINNLWCRPCSKIGYKKCPKGHFRCMNQISTDEILAAVHSFLA